ncbi:MAG: hypothetical protein KGZ25_12870 [Planctomycetes bacterium]|nr:hypothetical protein [Planctomycetota bacterium]
MTEALTEKLEKGEKPLWLRLPRKGHWRAVFLVIQIFGHLLLTILSVLFAWFLLPLRMVFKILLGTVLVVTTNAPLVAWAIKRLPVYTRSGDSIFFVTDRRVGILRPTGELQQLPLSGELELSLKAGVLEFSLGESHLCFAGLTEEEREIVMSLARGLVEKDNDSDEES